MTTETLRRAASLMRERAEAATPGPWSARPGSIDTGNAAVLGPAGSAVALPYCNTDAEHIASWHPAVALAVADWLDDLANRITLSRQLRHEDEERHALTVARAYLGEAS